MKAITRKDYDTAAKAIESEMRQKGIASEIITLSMVMAELLNRKLFGVRDLGESIQPERIA